MTKQTKLVILMLAFVALLASCTKNNTILAHEETLNLEESSQTLSSTETAPSAFVKELDSENLPETATFGSNIKALF